MRSDSDNPEMTPCSFCSQEIEEKNQPCVYSENPPPEKGKRRLINRIILAVTIGLFLFGVTAFLWMGDSESKPVGRVNGKEISKEEFAKRLDRAKKTYEYQYGKNLFEGEAGKENLTRVKTEVLDELVVEKILLQEAKSAGYALAPEEEIEKEVETIKKKNALSDESLLKMFGGSMEDLKAELRTGWVISQLVEKVVLKGKPANGNLLFGQWLTGARAKATIEMYEKLEPLSTAKASCCGSGGSGCGGGGVKARPLDPKIEQEARSKGLEYYEKKTQKKGASAKVTNFGCHVQVDIIEDGKVALSLTYQQGEIQEI